MDHACQDLREVARYNLGRKHAPKLVGMAVFCAVVSALLSLLISLWLDLESPQWPNLVFYLLSYWLCHTEYKKMMEKEMLRLKNKDLAAVDSGQTD